jgi:hypothetical protein
MKNETIQFYKQKIGKLMIHNILLDLITICH